MITPTTFLRAKQVIAPDARDMEIVLHHGSGRSFSLGDLLEEYHQIKMEEKGFKTGKDQSGKNIDTIKS